MIKNLKYTWIDQSFVVKQKPLRTILKIAKKVLKLLKMFACIKINNKINLSVIILFNSWINLH